MTLIVLPTSNVWLRATLFISGSASVVVVVGGVVVVADVVVVVSVSDATVVVSAEESFVVLSSLFEELSLQELRQNSDKANIIDAILFFNLVHSFVNLLYI